MIKFTMTNAFGNPVIGFGISERNVELLKEGKPIHVDLKEMGLEGEIVIFYGNTEADLFQQIQPMIGDQTVVIPMDKNA